METIKLKLTLCDNAINHLSSFTSKGIEVSDIINKLFTPKENNNALSANSKHTILARAHAYHARTINLSYTKYEFFERFKNNKAFDKLYIKYVKSHYDKNLRPSFMKNKELKKVKVMTYAKIMMPRSTKPIEHKYIGKITRYDSISKAVKATGLSRSYIQKQLGLDTKDGYDRFDYV